MHGTDLRIPQAQNEDTAEGYCVLEDDRAPWLAAFTKAWNELFGNNPRIDEPDRPTVTILARLDSHGQLFSLAVQRAAVIGY
jgi:hypothetical protein